MWIKPAAFGEHFDGGLERSMQQQFCTPGKEMRLTRLHFCRALVFFDRFEGTPLTFLKLRQLGMHVRVVFRAKLGSNGGSTRCSCVFRIAWGSTRLAVSFSDKRNCLLPQRIAARQDPPSPMSAQGRRIGNTRHGECG